MAIAQILHQYNLVSGQNVNLSKSNSYFRKKVMKQGKDKIKEVMGTPNEGGDGIYIGLHKVFVG